MTDGIHRVEDAVRAGTAGDATAEPDAGLPRGFLWGSVRAGIKESGALDLAAAVVTGGGVAAASYTKNAVVAAPVTLGREYLAKTGGRVSTVLVNAGNANCATGAAGLEACRQTCVAAAGALGGIFDEVFPSSTGIIGVPFPSEKVIVALPALREAMGGTIEHAEGFATAILTTDTRRKVARAVVNVDDAEVRLLGVCKGAGMIAPQMGLPVETAVASHATMLVYLFTDLAAEAEDLRALLAPAVEASFNSISIDGDTSTNDTVLLLASGGERGEGGWAGAGGVRECDGAGVPVAGAADCGRRRGRGACGGAARDGRGDGGGGEAGCADDCDQPAMQDGVVERGPKLGAAAGGGGAERGAGGGGADDDHDRRGAGVCAGDAGGGV